MYYMTFQGSGKGNLVYVTKDITNPLRYVVTDVFVLQVSGAYFHGVYTHPKVFPVQKIMSQICPYWSHD